METRHLINNINDYAKSLGTSVSSLKHDIYKYTDCGAWIDWNDESMTIGSIVEGSDAEFSKTFKFPVSMDEVDEWYEELEQLTEEAWHEANDGDEEVKDAKL